MLLQAHHGTGKGMNIGKKTIASKNLTATAKQPVLYRGIRSGEHMECEYIYVLFGVFSLPFFSA